MRQAPDDPDADAGPTPPLPGESSVAYAMSLKYRDLGPHRTVAGLLRSDGRTAEKKCRRQLEFWSARWGWVERARRFDAHNEAVAHRARDRVRAEYAALWERRAQDCLEHAYADAKRLRARASEMLAAPLYHAEERQEDSRTVVIRKPARWSFASAALMLKVSAELAQAAIAAVQDDRPLASMSDAELDAVASVEPRALDEDSGPLGA
jgi:hypothetical protein